MDPAQNQNNQNQANTQSQPAGTQKPAVSDAVPAAGSTTGIGKEREVVKVTSSEAVKEISEEVKVSKELEKAGVTEIAGEIELPPDVKKLGVVPSGSSTPVVQTVPLPATVLPISDNKVIKGLHEPVISSFRWLAEWCIKKLKKAHLALKVIHGKIVRVKTD